MTTHGTQTSYTSHKCRCQPCTRAMRAAQADYRRRVAYNANQPLLVSSTGTIRRIRALNALGWSTIEISRQIGVTSSWLYNIIHQHDRALLHPHTVARVAQVYNKLCMTPGVSVRARNDATRNRYAPPLAWDDIDDPHAVPQGIPELETTP